MEQFQSLLKEYKKWLVQFPFINLVLPYVMYLMFVSLGIKLFQDFFYLFNIRVNFMYSFVGLIGGLAKLTFLLGVWLSLITKEIKWTPYALWGYSFYLLFPFTSISIVSLLNIAIYAAFGYWLFKYTASSYSLE